jgi:hypothetical protein
MKKRYGGVHLQPANLDISSIFSSPTTNESSAIRSEVDVNSDDNTETLYF